MKFRDDRIIKYAGHSFEHSRIVQGVMIYVVFISLAVFGIINHQYSAFILLGIIALTYVSCLGYYARKRPLKEASLLALYKTISLPTSMVG